MKTVRLTVDVSASLIAKVVAEYPGVTKTMLVDQGLRALLAREAALRLAAAGGTAKGASFAKRASLAASGRTKDRRSKMVDGAADAGARS
jgi:hypothetical protein